MISASGLLESSHRLPALDYTDIIYATLQLTRDYREAEKMFRLMCFNVFAHNRDDHSKNFSFLYDDGKWSVSPAYDLVYAPGMGGEHATSIDGEGRNPTEKDLERVGAKTGVGSVNFGRFNIILEVKDAVDKSGLIKKYKK
jgi:serine/threonine-protein kinase HipA